MEANHKNLRPLLPEEICDVRLLRRLAREGRLYLDESPATIDVQAEAVERALEYVGQINQYAHPCAIPHISELWNEILTDPQLNDKLIIQKGRHEGELNRYRLMYLVTFLLEAGIYHRTTALRLHHVLEHTTKKDNIYKGQMKYAMEFKQMRHLSRVVSEFRTKFWV